MSAIHFEMQQKGKRPDGWREGWTGGYVMKRSKIKQNKRKQSVLAATQTTSLTLSVATAREDQPEGQTAPATGPQGRRWCPLG